MPELRKDPITGRWVIISTERGKRPNDFLRESVIPREEKNCPFCVGNEARTPPEILVYGRNGGGPNTPGWSIRVVPNKFPALGIEGELDREGEGLFDKMNGIGAHEVVIESPNHLATLATLPERAVEDVLWGYRDRMLDLKNDKRFRYILIFKNHGEAAGATIDHPHSQLIALPIVPRRVREDNRRTPDDLLAAACSRPGCHGSTTPCDDPGHDQPLDASPRSNDGLSTPNGRAGTCAVRPISRRQSVLSRPEKEN